MKVRFISVGQGIIEGVETLIAEFDVEKKPTKEQVQAIYAEINKVTEKYYDKEEDVTNEIYKKICYKACKKHLTIVKNPIVHTFYL